MSMLTIKDLEVQAEDKHILKGLNLELEQGKVYAIMGPNGSGKSTLASTILGSPKYEVTKGSIVFNGEELNELEADERAKKGIFLSFQYPKEISGLTITHFLRTAYNSVKDKEMSAPEFMKYLRTKMEILDMDTAFLKRSLNQGFSGGEKKKAEILQLLTLDPQLAILDETDSGLDIDALQVVAQGVNAFKNEEKTVVVITHYKRILEYIKPDEVIIVMDGKVVQRGAPELIDQLESQGYGWLNEE